MNNRYSLFRRSLVAAVLLQVFSPTVSSADGFLDTIRSLDLNNYALGTFFLTSTSYYEGIDDFRIIYPAPTLFGSAITSDETFFVRDGDFGLRKRFASGWDLGGLVSFQTLGYGSGASPTLAGMSRRNWTVQAGVTAGRQIAGIRVDVLAETDILDEHNGQEYTLKLAKVFEWPNLYLVPQVDILYQTADVVNHYFGVRPSEAQPGRPEYKPGSAVTYSANLTGAWRWHPKWFVYASGGIDKVPSEIRNSPVVDRDYVWSLSFGIGYDAPTMLAVDYDRVSDQDSSIEIGVGAFFAHSDAKVFLTDGTATVPVNLETDFNLDDTEVSVPVDVAWRIGRFHRIGFGFFQLKRSGVNDLVVPVDVGDVTFPAGETVQTSFDTSFYELAYAFSLIRDSQKELSLIGGIQVSDISYRSASGTETAVAETTSLLPVIGADLTVNFTDRLTLDVMLQFWALDFGKYSGNLTDFGFFARYQLLDALSVSAGYKFYRQDIDSADENFFGDYRFEYRGPIVDIRARF